MKMRNFKILIVIFTAAFVTGLFISPAFAQRSEMRSLEQSETSVTSSYQEAPTRQRVEYNAENFKDPFKGAAAQEAPAGEQVAGAEQSALPEMTVQGVIWGGKFPQAIINSQVVKTGDMIEGAKVVSISKDGVTLFFQGRQMKVPAPAAAPVIE